jgi:hypothetical protein
MNTKRSFLLVVTCLLLCSPVLAGVRKGPQAGAPKAVTGEEVITHIFPDGAGYPTAYNLGAGDSIGFTTYDYGTNGSANRNLIIYGNTI